MSVQWNSGQSWDQTKGFFTHMFWNLFWEGLASQMAQQVKNMPAMQQMLET